MGLSASNASILITNDESHAMNKSGVTWCQSNVSARVELAHLRVLKTRENPTASNNSSGIGMRYKGIDNLGVQRAWSSGLNTFQSRLL
jgi:hypothetical protein